MTNLICITCPKGCHLTVDEENDYKVTGNACPRGAEYGRNEMLHPVRVITSTVKIEVRTLRGCRSRLTARLPRRRCLTACS